MSNYTSSVYYSIDNGKTYINLYGSGSNGYYSGSISRSVFNDVLPQLNYKYAIFKTYKSGTLADEVISDTQYIYAGGTHMQFTSYYTAHEHRYMCVANKGEFTSTSNPTLYDISGSLIGRMESIDSAGSSSILEVDENFRTYATAIGLYDDSDRLVAYGKFANAIKIEKDLDSVFVIKFDV